MKMQKLTIAIALVLVAAISAAQPEDAQLRKDMETFFAKVDRLISNGSPQLWSLFHPGYTCVDTEGKSANLTQFRERLATGMANARDVKTQMNVKHVRRHLNEAAIWIEEITHFKKRANGRWTEMKSTTRWAETLVRTSTGWKFMYSQELPMSEPWPFKVG